MLLMAVELKEKREAMGEVIYSVLDVFLSPSCPSQASQVLTWCVFISGDARSHALAPTDRQASPLVGSRSIVVGMVLLWPSPPKHLADGGEVDQFVLLLRTYNADNMSATLGSLYDG